MDKTKLQIPEGFKDVMYYSCRNKKQIENSIRNTFIYSGFNEVETPSIEYYDLFENISGDIREETMFKLFDNKGRILAIRPDITTSIARIATQLKKSQIPVRFSYIQKVFRNNAPGSVINNPKEFTQAGAEIIGSTNPEADAEVIILMIEAFKKLSIEKFHINIGHEGFLKAIAKELKLSETEYEEFIEMMDENDFYKIEEFIKDEKVTGKLQEIIYSLPKLKGKTTIIDTAVNMCVNENCKAALKNLKEVCRILEDVGYGQYISVDLSMSGGLNYYTGVVFKGYIEEYEYKIINGGRYDKILEGAGKKTTGVGGIININRLLIAQNCEENNPELIQPDSLICYKESGRQMAFRVANELRNQGVVIEMHLKCDDIEGAIEHAKSREIAGVIAIHGDESIEIYDLTTGDIKKTTLGEMLGE